MTPTMPIARTTNRRASATVEFIILLPVYLLIFLGIWYLAQVSFLRERSLEANRVAGSRQGDQSEDEDGRGEISRMLFDRSAGSLTLRERHEPFPKLPDIDRILYPPPPPPGDPPARERRPPSATGHTDIDLDSLDKDLETVIRGGRGTGPPPAPPPPPPPPPRDFRLMRLVQEAMGDWIIESGSRSRYRYEPEYLSLQHVSLRPVTPSANHQTMGRTGDVREIRDEEGHHQGPQLIDRLQDGETPVPGFPRFADLPKELMSPN